MRKLRVPKLTEELRQSIAEESRQFFEYGASISEHYHDPRDSEVVEWQHRVDVAIGGF